MATDGSDYVSGSSVDWRRLMSHSVGAFVLLYVQFWADWIGRMSGAISTIIGGVGGWLESIVYQTVTLPSDGLQAAWQTSAEWIEPFGLFGWIIGIVLLIVVVDLVFRMLRYQVSQLTGGS